MMHAGDDSTSLTTGQAAFTPSEIDTRSVDELEEEIAELCTHIDAATYRLLRAIGEFDRREAWGWGFQSTAHWLTWRVGIDLVTAREKVRVARALENLPRISDTFRQGKVSYSKVRAMTRMATAENEEYLLYIAENGTASDVETLVRAYRRSNRREDLDEARRQREERYLEMYTDEDGMVVIRGRLPQEVAALLEKALEAAMDALNEEEKAGDEGKGSVIAARTGIREQPTDLAPPDDSAESQRHAAAASVIPAQAGIQKHSVDVRLCLDSAESCPPAVIPTDMETPQHHIDLHLPKSFRKSLTRSDDDSAESSPSRVIPLRVGMPQSGDTFAQRRVDALGLLAEAALGRGLGRTVRGEPYQVMIHVDADVLAGKSHDGRCELENGEGISAESCRRLACDAPHVTVAEDAEGNVLHIGRKARKISKPLWRALMSRDRACRFPGCNKTRHLQAHHIEHWAKGGETNPDNLVLLCRAHHWAVHEGGVRVEGRVPVGIVFHRPDGSPLPACPVPIPINGEAGETLKQANRRHGLEITSNTVDSFWDGERMDLHMAVDGLLEYEDDPTAEE